MIAIIKNETRLDNIGIRIDRSHQAIWATFLHPGRPVFTTGLLEDFHASQEIVADLLEYDQHPEEEQIRYLIVNSALPGAFCVGGDLAHFLELIQAGDRDGLSRYAHACTDMLYRSVEGYSKPLCSICLVEGDTLGGGFELALAADVLVAEKNARFGFPETQFGLFPGMGAFSLLSRKINPALAKRLITSGNLYTAAELYDMGVVDLLAEDGRGEEMVHHYIKRRQPRESGYQAIEKIMAQHHPITHRELSNIVDLWVDTAMELSEKNLQMMRYLLKAQRKRWGSEQKSANLALLRA